MIGDGHQAKVYRATQADKAVAVKIFNCFATKDQMYQADTEFKIGKCLGGHPHIVQISEFAKGAKIIINGKEETRDVMVLEHCKNGDLYEFITHYTNKQISLGEKNKGLYASHPVLLQSIFSQLISAVRVLHLQAGFAHLDIKLENILIDNSGILKLCDFGFSAYSQTLVCKKLGTEAYMAPEIHEARLNPCKAFPTDVFSLGVLFFILAFGAPPFHQAQKTDTYFKFIKQKPGSPDFFKFHPHTRTLFRDNKLDQGMLHLILSMLHVDPQQRPSIEEVSQFPFVT